MNPPDRSAAKFRASDPLSAGAIWMLLMKSAFQCSSSARGLKGIASDGETILKAIAAAKITEGA
jgi:hypothetical protein